LLQVEDVDAKFVDLGRLKAANWIEVQPSPVKRKVVKVIYAVEVSHAMFVKVSHIMFISVSLAVEVSHSRSFIHARFHMLYLIRKKS